MLVNFAAGCGSSSPAGSSGAAGTTGSGTAGTTGSGTAGTSGRPRRDDGRRRDLRRCWQYWWDDRQRRRAGVPARRRGAGGSGAKIPIGSTQCSDGIDNDGDGKIDYDDPECVGPLDNDESSFATGIPGDNMDACKQDCFFDGNSGAGDDHCDWQLKCDPLSATPSARTTQQYADSTRSECSLSASQSPACIDFCRQLVPNGCDCFGCCAIRALPRRSSWRPPARPPTSATRPSARPAPR